MKALCILLAPLLLAAQPIDLGLITDRWGKIIKLPPGRTDVLRFEMTAQPSIMTNTITFTLTNQLIEAANLPLPNGPGLLVGRVEWKDGSYSRPITYIYNLFKGETDGPTLEPVSIIKPDATGVVEKAISVAKSLPPIVMPPLPPMTEERAATPLPDAAPEGMRHYYQRQRRDGSTVITNAPRSRIRRVR